MVSPAWEARTVTGPVPVRVRVEPERVAGPETTVKVGVRLLVEEAERAKAASPKVLSARGAKVRVWEACATLKERSTGVAAA